MERMQKNSLSIERQYAVSIGIIQLRHLYKLRPRIDKEAQLKTNPRIVEFCHKKIQPSK